MLWVICHLPVLPLRGEIEGAKNSPDLHRQGEEKRFNKNQKYIMKTKYLVYQHVKEHQAKKKTLATRDACQLIARAKVRTKKIPDEKKSHRGMIA